MPSKNPGENPDICMHIYMFINSTILWEASFPLACMGRHEI